MNLLEQDYPAILSAGHQPPCLSLYQPTHRKHPDNAQDSIRFKNLVKKLEESLRKKYPNREIETLLKPFLALAEDREFWNHTTEGLAILSAPGLFRVYKLQRPVAELVVVADTFHTKPLMRIVQSADRYQILALNRNGFKVFEGNRDALVELPAIEGVPQTAIELLGKEIEGEGINRSHGRGTGQGSTIQHGPNVKQETDERDTQAFFRAVDKTVQKNHSQPSELGLILAALPEYHHTFRTVSHNSLLMKEAINIHPDDLSLDALREQAWQLVQPYYLKRLAGLVESYGKAVAAGQGTDELSTIASAASTGKIATLLIEADRLIPGRFDAASGVITLAELNDPEVDDLLDDIGEMVLKSGGSVVIVPTERMPTKTGAAAIQRF